MMQNNEIPNGFTGFSKKRPSNFSSAADELRQHEERLGEYKTTSKNQLFQNIEAANAEDALNDSTKNYDNATSFNPEELDKIPETSRRWSWVEVDLSAIRHNAMAVKKLIGPGKRLMAVVKANAYGHGSVRVAKTALNSGADYLGVATIDEGIELRRGLVNAPILLLSQPPIEAVELLVAYKIMPSVYTAEFAIAYGEAADAHGQKAPFHLAVNTGMNRIGVHYSEVVPFLQQVAFHRALELVGTFTHFATADCHEELDFQIQAGRFSEAIDNIRSVGISPGIVHAANTAAAIRYPNVVFDMVRLGIGLYGYYPCHECANIVDLRPSMSVHARITDMRLVPMSEGVSYGLNYRSPGSVKICTIPVGYADGLSRALSGRVDFIVDGVLCKQVGNICMDQCMFEVDLRSYASRRKIDPQVGDEVVLVGSSGNASTTIEDLCSVLHTIPYEVCTGFSQRMPIVYV